MYACFVGVSGFRVARITRLSFLGARELSKKARIAELAFRALLKVVRLRRSPNSRFNLCMLLAYLGKPCFEEYLFWDMGKLAKLLTI